MNDKPQEHRPDVPAADTNAPRQKEDTTIEYDRRGKPLPPKQRVGGIITPQ